MEREGWGKEEVKRRKEKGKLGNTRTDRGGRREGKEDKRTNPFPAWPSPHKIWLLPRDAAH